MRKINFNKKSFSALILLFAIVTGMVIQSCQTEDSVDQDNLNQKSLQFEFEQTSKQDIQKISKWYNGAFKKNIINLSNKRIKEKIKKEIEYDFESSVSHYINETDEIIIVKQKGASMNNKINYALSFIKYPTETRSFFIIKTTNVSENIKKIEYYNFYNTLVLSSIFNNNDKTITNTKFSEKSNKKNTIRFTPKHTFSSVDITFNSVDIMNNQRKMDEDECYDGSLAEYTLECIEDAYTNHGWLSVWAVVQSAIIWQTGPAIAVACAVEGVTNGNCYTSF